MSHRTARKLTLSSLESLEDRVVLSTTPAVNAFEQLVDTRGGAQIGIVYTEFVNYYQSGSQGTFVSSQARHVVVSGETVGVDLRFSSGTVQSNAAAMAALGMDVTATVPSADIVEGLMPIYQLPAVAENANISGISPVEVPTQSITPTPSPSPSAVVALKGGPTLGNLYQELYNYEVGGAQGTFAPSESSQIVINGMAVGVDIRTTAANYQATLAQMKAMGMLVTATASTSQIGVIEGLVPIANLAEIASNNGVVGMSPIYRPSHF